METGGGRIDPRPLTREEEAVKRNTDCVYFLASPLTCKKGSECEYRHSEGARVNPRDCKFWFSGSCLNPKCFFRHPPLDGPVGNPVAISVPVMTASPTTASTQPPMAYNSSRNNVPCYYFQNGTCLKGDKCPFMHGTQPACNPVAKQSGKLPAPASTRLEISKKDALKLKECGNQHNMSTASSLCKVSAEKQVYGEPSSVEDSMKFQNDNIHLVHKRSLYPLATVDVQSDWHGLNEREAGEILDEASEIGYTKLKRPVDHHLHSSGYQNGKGVEGSFREFSPGFDVLVDNAVNVADYLHAKDGFRSGSIQDGKNKNYGDGNDHRLGGIESATLFDGDQNDGESEFQHHRKGKNGGNGDLHWTFSVSERILDKPSVPERRSAHSLRSSDGVDESDLRFRLMKQRRLNSSLSATISDRENEPYSRYEQNMQDRNAIKSSREQRQRLSKSTISSRLGGRIALPKPPSPEFSSEFQGGRDRRSQRSRLSPSRTSNLHGRLGDRLSRRPVEDFSRSQTKASHIVDPLDFAGPRSLAELKGAKAEESSPDQSTKSNHYIPSLEHDGMKFLKAAALRDSEALLAFDGPKPLSVLLKRNRVIGEIEADSRTSNAGLVSKDVSLECTKSSINISEDPVEGTAVEGVVESEEKVVHIPSEISHYQQQAAEDEEPDYTDQKDGDYDYETVESRDYKTEDENMDLMNIDDDEEGDEDDFAKKIGLIFT